MDTATNGADVAKPRSGKRGSQNIKKSLEAFRKKAKRGPADWGGCDSALMQTIVVEMNRLGGAVIFGLSRDGGAHQLTLLVDREKETLWFNGDADLDQEMRNVLGMLEAEA